MPVEKFSVIIPTLQRSPELEEIARQCAAHPDVEEVLVINNAAVPLPFDTEGITVLEPGRNIFVNPAWNLGVESSRGALLAIINDDVRFEDEALAYAAQLLRGDRYGIVGHDRTCFLENLPPRPISHRVYADRSVVTYGTFLCLRRENYSPIPEELRIWHGDDWLILHQRKLNAVLIGTPFRTEMSTTSSSPEFVAMQQDEARAAARHLLGIKRPLRIRFINQMLRQSREFRHRVEHARSARS